MSALTDAIDAAQEPLHVAERGALGDPALLADDAG